MKLNEKKSKARVFSILQLRLHPSILSLKDKLEKVSKFHKIDVKLKYITSRGKWYFESWKGDEKKSGGIATNIGVHFFDMLQWIFGDVTAQKVNIRTHDRASGTMYFVFLSSGILY